MAQLSNIPFEIFTIDGLYSDDVLEQWLKYIKESKNKSICPFTMANFKNGKVIYPEWSGHMYSKIAGILPKDYTDRNNTQWTYVSAAKYIMFAHIEAGQMFGIHTDTGCEYDITNNLYSKYTVLTYLNDDFEGGETQFYDDNFAETVTIKPKKGRTLIFDIDRFHKGNAVLSGEKYWIGTELVCAKCAF